MEIMANNPEGQVFPRPAEIGRSRRLLPYCELDWGTRDVIQFDGNYGE